MLSESEWIQERLKLYALHETHPDWSVRVYAREVGHDPKWVSKWLKRFAGMTEFRLEAMRSRSRRPQHSPRRLVKSVKDQIGVLRETLSERFHRAAGPKLIAHYLAKEPIKAASPPSLSSIRRVLCERGFIRPRPIPTHEPLVLPAPNEEWELDFGEIYLGPVEGSLEFMLVVDRGSSRVIYIEGSVGYRAVSALEAAVRLFGAHGLPKRLRFDRDPRLWGSWTRDSYPSPFIRLLRALGIEPVICPPHRPDKKPMVERGIGTLKHEWLARHSPTTYADAHDLLAPFIVYHNTLRPHQGQACGNRIPDEVFPNLLALPTLPVQVKPDSWVQAEEGRVYRRRVNSGGSIQVDRHSYYIGLRYAGAVILLQLDAANAQFYITLNGSPLKALPIRGLHPAECTLDDYLELLKPEAQFIEQNRIDNWQQRGDLVA